jgi:hypothetical protein
MNGSSKFLYRPLFLALGLLLAGANVYRTPRAATPPAVTVQRTPDGGIQPQVVKDSKGGVHLLFFKGDPGQGDLYYSKLPPGKSAFTPPLRVNRRPGTAIAVGTIRGGQIALGKGDRVHVAWNGSDRALPKRPKNSSPMLYTRMNDAGTAFEPERNLMRRTFYLDGGGTLTADAKGDVFVAWHAADPASKDEAGRKLWVAASRDEGKTFSPEVRANPAPTGACACCSVRAFTDRRGDVLLLYRAAKQNVHRDMTLLVSRDRGRTFSGRDVHPWDLNTCPMSSESFAEGPGGVYAAWETKSKVYFARVDPKTMRTSPPVAAPWHGKGQKHPSLAVNGRGEVLVAWTEGVGWQQGGDLAWQLYDRNGKPTREKGLLRGAVPIWGLVAAYTRPDGRMVVLY